MAAKVLFVKADMPGGTDLEWLDRVCHGLLSWSLARGLAAGAGKFPLLQLAPRIAPVNRAYLWPEKSSFPWNQILCDDSETWECYWSGDFSADELKVGARLFAGLQQWKPIPAQKLEAP